MVAKNPIQKFPAWVPWTIGGLVIGGSLYALARRSTPALKAPPAPRILASVPLAAHPAPAVSPVTSTPAPAPPVLSQRLFQAHALTPRFPTSSPTPSLESTLAQYNLAQLNRIRSARKLHFLTGDALLDAFARVGSDQLSTDHVAHAHFKTKAVGAPGIGNHAAENQGDARGVSILDTDPVRNGQKQIDRMLSMMMAEGPGGPHYDTIINPVYRRVGFGLLTIDGRLYMTNDFSS